LNADQLAAKLFDRVVIETATELYTAIGNAALGHEAPKKTSFNTRVKFTTESA
jgi:hypothetical protein